MKRLFTLLAAVAIMSAWQKDVMGQCSIDANDTSLGFSPHGLPCIEQGVVYGQALQVHLPGTVYVAAFGINIPIDSIKVLTIGGLPNGITWSATPSTATVPGGGNGCLWFSGLTNSQVGNYPLTFQVRVYTPFIDTVGTLNNFGLGYTLSVCASEPQNCDTFFNITGSQVEVPQIAGGGTGFFTGNNSFNPYAIAEEFSPATRGTQLGGTFFGFEILTISPGDSDKMITIQVLNDDSANAFAQICPGTVLGSDSFTFRSLIPFVAPDSTLIYYHQFSNLVTIPDTAFFVAVLIPTNPGDTIALWTSPFNDTSGTAFFNWPGTSDSGWFTIGDFTNGETNVNLTNLFIGAWLCDYTVAEFAAYSPSGLLSSVLGCYTDTVQYADESEGTITNWNWSFPGGSPNLSAAQNPAVVYNTPGTYQASLTVTDVTGLTSTYTLTNYVTLSSPAINIAIANASDSTAPDGSAVATVSNGIPPYQYAWNNNVSASADTGLVPGVYTVTVSDSIGCVTSDTAYINLTGINSINGVQKIKIYPNPTASTINVEWSGQAEAQVDIIDMTGKLLKSYAVDGTLLNTFDICDLAAGTYIVKITDRISGQNQSITLSKQ